MDMELLNAISEMMDKKLDERFEKNNEILRQEINDLRQEMKQNNDSLRQEMLEDHNRLFNQFSALIEEKVTKEIRAIAEGHKILLDRLDNRSTISELKEVKDDLGTCLLYTSPSFTKAAELLLRVEGAHGALNCNC